MNITLTTDWILSRMSHTYSANGDGVASLYCDDAVEYHLMDLAFEQMKIDYDIDEYKNDYGGYTTEFMFFIEDIKLECPILYRSLKNLNFRNSKQGRRKYKLEKILKI